MLSIWKIIFTLVVLILYQISGLLACQAGNVKLQRCLHGYMERDFIMLQELLQRPPYGENGHLLIEEADFEHMCERFVHLKKCYESQISTCNTFPQYSHFVRILRLLDKLEKQFCSESYQGLRDLILGGYCIEWIRKGTICQATNESPEMLANRTANYSLTFDLQALHSYPPAKQWPYTIFTILQLEAGKEVCGYLEQFIACLEPYVNTRCHEASQSTWNQSMNSLNDTLCNSTYGLYSDRFLSFVILFIIIFISIQS